MGCMCADLLLSVVLPTCARRSSKYMILVVQYRLYVCLLENAAMSGHCMHTNGETSSIPEYCEGVTLLTLDLEAMACSSKLQRFLQYFSTSGICGELLAHESSSLFVVRSSTNTVINK